MTLTQAKRAAVEATEAVDRQDIEQAIKLLAQAVAHMSGALNERLDRLERDVKSIKLDVR